MKDKQTPPEVKLAAEMFYGIDIEKMFKSMFLNVSLGVFIYKFIALFLPKPDPNDGYWCFYSCCPEAGLEISVLRHPTKSVKYNFHVNYERLRKNTYLDGTESNKDIQFIAHLRLGIYMERIVKPSLGLDVLKSTK